MGIKVMGDGDCLVTARITNLSRIKKDHGFITDWRIARMEMQSADLSADYGITQIDAA
jgi:hypothetical protein